MRDDARIVIFNLCEYYCYHRASSKDTVARTTTSSRTYSWMQLQQHYHGEVSRDIVKASSVDAKKERKKRNNTMEKT